MALEKVVQASEGALMGAVYRLTREVGLTGLGLQEGVSLSALSDADLSQHPLFELSGAPVGRLRTTVMDRFDGRNWTSSPELSREHHPLPGGGEAR